MKKIETPLKIVEATVLDINQQLKDEDGIAEIYTSAILNALKNEGAKYENLVLKLIYQLGEKGTYTNFDEMYKEVFN